MAPVSHASLSARGTTLLRWGLGLLFVVAGASKLFALAATATVLADRHVPFPYALALGVGLVEAVGGALLLAGRRVRPVARALVGLVVLAAIVFHNPLGWAPGLAHAKAVALTVDVLVLLGLAQLARS